MELFEILIELESSENDWETRTKWFCFMIISVLIKFLISNGPFCGGGWRSEDDVWYIVAATHHITVIAAQDGKYLIGSNPPSPRVAQTWDFFYFWLGFRTLNTVGTGLDPRWKNDLGLDFKLNLTKIYSWLEAKHIWIPPRVQLSTLNNLIEFESWNNNSWG